MTDKRTQHDAENSNMAKDPDEWVTGDEPMTGAQQSYLKTLLKEAHEAFDENLTKAEASKRIEKLQQRLVEGLLGRLDREAYYSAPPAAFLRIDRYRHGQE